MAQRRCCGCMNMVSEPVCPHCGCPEGFENAHHQLPCGTWLQGRYLIGSVLGQGGFGITYLGWDEKAQRVVAVKEYYPGSKVNRDHARSHQVRLNTGFPEVSFVSGKKRFLRESQALSALTDIPQIVQAYDAFEGNNTCYIVMEYIRGVDLQTYVQKINGPMSIQQTLKILEPVMLTLHKVHQAGLVHRDISPDNIMLHPTEGAKLLDFGASREVLDPSVNKDLPQSTEAILKQGFSPMEQYRTRGSLGPWTDGYALCATIWFCVTGKVPPDALTLSLEDAELDWGKIPGLTARQRRALEKGMAIAPEDRFPTVEALHDALFSQKAEPAPQKNRFRLWLAIGAGILVILAAVLIAVRSINPQPGQTDFREHISAERETVQPSTQAATLNVSDRWQDNVLRNDPLERLGIDKMAVESVTFLDDTANAPASAVSLGSGSCVGWYNGGEVFIAADGGINGVNACKGLFHGCENLHTVRFQGALHTEEVTNMDDMFRECFALEEVDAENLNTSRVVSMSHMFTMVRTGSGGYYEDDPNAWSHLSKLDVSSWDVSSVRDMSDMFYDCSSLRELDVSGWDVSNVTTFQRMFCGCSGLRKLDVSHWATASVTNFSAMFFDCMMLNELDVSRWDLASATETVSMFNGCSALTQLDVANWNLSGVTLTRYMFNGCQRLERLNAEDWNMSSVTDVSFMFHGCVKLKSLDWSGWDLSNVTKFNDFYHESTFCAIPWEERFQ